MKKKPKRFILKLIFFLFLVGMGYYIYYFDDPTGFAIFGPKIIEENSRETEIYFSYETDLTEKFSEFIRGTENTLDCALYDIGETIESVLKEKEDNIEIRIIKDDETGDLDLEYKEDNSGLMHNKFCIRDNNVVWTGSYNPTERGTLNNNNVLLLYSKHSIDNYNNEFIEMWNGEFKKGSKVKYPKIKINGKLYEFYFCPEDDCADKVYDELARAKESIYFMTFSFTRQDFVELLQAKVETGVEVNGLYEAQRRNMQYNTYNDLKDDINAYLDTNSYIMHHKVFVIDRSVVITGSMNPTKGGDERNDENLIIIRDPEIAELYIEEFGRLTS